MTMISNTVAFRWKYPGYMFDAFISSLKARFVVAIIYANYGFRFVYAPNNVIDTRV